MELRDWLTLIALVLGPVSAVVITLWIESARREREGRLRIVRMLLATRHMPAHQDYNSAINLIPAEFNDQEEVMTAWRRYLDLVNQRVPQGVEADHKRRIDAAQSALIVAAMKCIGLALSEGDIQTLGYASQGFVDRDNIVMGAAKALPELAEAMKAQVKHTERLLEMMTAAQQQNKPQG
jgi:hypothetical protein